MDCFPLASGFYPYYTVLDMLKNTSSALDIASIDC